jgi:hypothetical protein
MCMHKYVFVRKNVNENNLVCARLISEENKIKLNKREKVKVTKMKN